MVKKVLIIADSVLEIILSMWLKESYFKNDDVTFIITDRSASSSVYFKNIQRLGYFKNTYHIKAMGFPRSYAREEEQLILNDREEYRKFCLKIIESHLKEDCIYDCFVTSEVDIFSRSVYKFLKNKNQNIESYFLGEGIYAHKGFAVSLQERLNSNDSFKDLIEDYRALFLYRSQMDIAKYRDIKWLPEFRENIDFIKKYLNKAFGYIPHKKIYENKIIFFEESHVQDGGNSNNIVFVKHLIEKYGKNRVVVKRHPRSRLDRFKQLQVEQITDYYIPWELFILNRDCRNCILCAGYSLSLINTAFWDLDGEKNRIIMLYKILNEESGFSKSLSGNTYYEYLRCILNDSQIDVPYSVEDFDKIIDLVDF